MRDDLSGNIRIWAMVTVYGPESSYHKRSFVRFERDVCFVVDPGRNMFDVIPKKVERTDSLTLVVDTGSWKYGKVTMQFESSTDADLVEQKLRAQLKGRFPSK